MTAAVADLLRSFEALSELDKHDLASAVLRWSLDADHPPLTDDELVQAAASVFVELDRQESEGA